MKIRTRIYILLLLASLFLPLACGVALLTEHEVDTEIAEMQRAEQLLRTLADLRSVAMESALLHDANGALRWQEKTGQLRTILIGLAPEHQYPGSRFAELTRLAEQLQGIFRQFSRPAAPAAPQAIQPTPDAARTVSNIFATLQTMTEIGHELNRHDVDETKEALRTMQAVTILTILGLSILMIVLWQLIQRKLLGPLQTVEAGTRRIANGDYRHRLNLAQRDEIGVLADAFDRMTTEVERNAASLQAEIENSRRAKQALSDSVQYTETILAHAVDGILTLDPQYRIQSANRALQTLFGYPAPTLIGRPFLDLLAPTSQSEWHAFCERLEQAPVSDGHAAPTPWFGQNAAGQLFPLELALVRTQHRGQVLYVGIVRDISERLRVEKMKTELVSTVSHELRTPLTSITGSLGLVLGNAMGQVPAPMAGLLSIAHKNSLRLAHLVNDLLDMEKLVAGQLHFDLKPHALLPLVEQSVESVAAYGARLQVAFEIGQRDEVQVRVDADRLQQVLANLLSNAAKYSAAGDVVQIDVRQEGNTVRVEVIDHGPGIPAPFHERIFQKFSQADSSDTREKGGTGLGLAISKELIERMNGLIGFDSVPGVRTCFYFALPLFADPMPHPEVLPLDPASANPWFLIIDDDPDIAALLQLQVQRLGYQADLAYDATHALAHLAERHYRLILLDLMLPDQSGIRLIEQIRAQPEHATLPIIIVSAWVREGKISLPEPTQNLAWIRKPYEEAELRATIGQMLAAN